MKYLKLFLFVMLWAVSLPASAQSEYNYSLAEGYTISIYGNASFHNWDVVARQAEGITAVYWNDDGSFDLNQLELLIEVKSLASSGGSVMDNNTYQLLKLNQFPKISFLLTSPIEAIPADGRSHPVSAKGNLSVAGVTEQVVLHGNVLAEPGGNLVFEGAKLLDLRDFNIVPPSALFGVLKVGNEVSIQFKVSFTKYLE